MAKVRVDVLAKELELGVDDLFAQLKGMGFDVVNTTSTVDREMVDMVKDMLTGQPPKKRAAAGRRIVSVHKGATSRTPEVEVRVEEEPPSPEVAAAEAAPPEAEPAPVEASPAAPPAGDEAAVKPKKKRLTKAQAKAEEEAAAIAAAAAAAEPVVEPVAVAPAPEAAPAVEAAAPAAEPAPVPAVTEAPQPLAAADVAPAPAAPAKPKKREDDSPVLTAMGIEAGIRTPGKREIGIVQPTVIERAPPPPIVRPSGPVVPGAPAVEEEKKVAKEKPKRAATKKEKKVTRADLMRQVEDLTAVVDEEVPAELKVVEIKHAPAPVQHHQPQRPGGGRRPEPPRRKPKKGGGRKQAPAPAVPLVKRTLRIEPGVTVASLAGMTGTRAPILIKMLFDLGIMTTINQPIEPETAALLATDLGYETELKTGKIEEIIAEAPEDEAAAVPRPPVVTVMGHVDHGKTSLLDAIRSADVAAGEAGGITQHIGAYTVHHAKGSLTFLDTPGHEAFTAMRARGARVTDLVVLVVAADDGVMPQTVEAIDHAKAAGVPILVAVNKIDKPGANPDRVKQALSEKGLVPEEWGGDTLYAYVSAKQKTNIDGLLDSILLQAEMMNLKADPTREARGSVVESRLDKGRGPVATVLVQKGTLRVGDLIVVGAVMGKVRAMHDDKGKKIKEALPSTPVEVVGLPDVPPAGESFLVFRDELKARRVAAKNAEAGVLVSGTREKLTLEDLFSRIKEGEVKELRLVIKADVQGSVEALRESLLKLSTEAVRVKVIHTATGGINESDVTLAMASDAIIIGFNVRPDGKSLDLARKEQVDVRFYNVIYNAVDDVRNALRGLLAPILREKFLGRAEVRQTFSVPKIGVIAGSYVQDGVIRRNAKIRVLRDGVVVNEGKISSLKRFKDDAREVASGYECGIGVENFNDLKPGDILEAVEIVEEAAEL